MFLVFLWTRRYKMLCPVAEVGQTPRGQGTGDRGQFRPQPIRRDRTNHVNLEISNQADGQRNATQLDFFLSILN